MPNKITRALISVSDKTGLLPFCQQLTSAGIAIISSGGTYKLLSEHGIAASEVSAYTDFPEMMGGRIKTLHPKVHGGILARRGIDEEVMAQNGILPIDLVVSNLYPFVQTISQPDCDLARAIENIDIGGPALIRAAAKNYQSVAVVVDPTDYSAIIEQLQQNHGLTESTRLAMASKAFTYTASYDTAIAGYFAKQCNGGFPATLNRQWTHKQTLRYGENPHQQAAFYQELSPVSGTISRAVQIQGKELSYNNIADADVALECVKSFGNRPSCVIVKHANPCGVASCHSISAAYDLAYATDPTSAFGGVIAFNKPLDSATAAAIVARQFVEVLIAPKIDAYAKKVLEAKAKIRVLECGDFLASRNEAGEDNGTFCPNGAALDCKRVAGGLLVQDQDRGTIDRHCLKIVSRRQPTEQQLDDLLFAWQVAKFVKSNAIVYCKNGQTVGIGAGQMSRVYSAKIAGIKAAEQNLPVQGSAMASDAFFPFRDGIDLAAADGIASIIQPGGSIRDNEVIAAADEHNIAMVFTAMRHFRH